MQRLPRLGCITRRKCTWVDSKHRLSHPCTAVFQPLKVFSTLASPPYHALSVLSWSFSPRCSKKMSVFWTFHNILHSWETALGQESIGCFEAEGQVSEGWAPQQGWEWGRVLGELEFVLSHLMILFSWNTKTNSGKSSQLIAWDVGSSKMYLCFQVFAELWQKAVPLSAAGKTCSIKTAILSLLDSNRKSLLASGSKMQALGIKWKEGTRQKVFSITEGHLCIIFLLPDFYTSS